MSIKDRLSIDLINKLTEMKKQDFPAFSDDKSENAASIMSLDEQEIRQELLRQAQEENEIDMNFFTGINGPQFEEGDEKLVEVHYLGYPTYVDISFESVTEDMTEEEFMEIMDAIEVIAFETDKTKIKQAVQTIEEKGEKAIEVIFREANKFDLTNPSVRKEVVTLLSRLCVRSLKGRRLILAILQKANSEQHIKLAMYVAGMIHDKETVPSILQHMKDPEYFVIAFEALLNIRDSHSVKELLSIIDGLDINRKDLIDQAVALARRFHVFDPSCVKEVYEVYIRSEKYQLRPIYTAMLISFQENAIPVLLEMLEKEKNVDRLNRICLTLGSLRHSFATKILVQALKKFPEKKSSIIKGLSHSYDRDVSEVLVQELENNEDIHIKRECIQGLSFIGNRHEHGPIVKKYLKEGDPLYLDALFCMIRFGSNEAFEKYVQVMVTGDPHQQYVAEKFTNRLPNHYLLRLAEKMVELPDDKAIFIILALQRPSKFKEISAQIGQLLLKKLESNPNDTVRLEIYRLIGKHANTKDELVNETVLYNAREAETNPRIKRELDQIILNMKQEKGKLTVKRD
jgi:hypothetical protein